MNPEEVRPSETEPRRATMPQSAISIELTADELQLLRNALETYLSDFGHDNHDVVRRTHDVIAKLAAAASAVPINQATG
jgi:hypothetical protein